MCGLCTEIKVDEEKNKSIITLFIEGRAIIVNVSGILSENLKFHSLRIVGIPYKDAGLLKIEALEVYDRGISYPINGRIYK